MTCYLCSSHAGVSIWQTQTVVHTPLYWRQEGYSGCKLCVTQFLCHFRIKKDLRENVYTRNGFCTTCMIKIKITSDWILITNWVFSPVKIPSQQQREKNPSSKGKLCHLSSRKDLVVPVDHPHREMTVDVSNHVYHLLFYARKTVDGATLCLHIKVKRPGGSRASSEVDAGDLIKPDVYGRFVHVDETSLQGVKETVGCFVWTLHRLTTWVTAITTKEHY